MTTDVHDGWYCAFAYDEDPAKDDLSLIRSLPQWFLQGALELESAVYQKWVERQRETRLAEARLWDDPAMDAYNDM